MKAAVTLAIPVLVVTAALALKKAPEDQSAPKVQPVSAQLRKNFNLDPFYQKALIVETFPILSSEKVPPQ